MTIDAIKSLMRFDYRTDFNWKFNGPGYDNVIITTQGKIMTPSLKYYNVEDVDFEFNTPVGKFWKETVSLDKRLKKLKKLMNKNQAEFLVRNTQAAEKPNPNTFEDMPIGAIISYSFPKGWSIK